MEILKGKESLELNVDGFADQLAKYQRVFLDLGTGDGSYARYLAERNPEWFIIGMDACRENLRSVSRLHLQNILFVIANAETLPCELNGIISHISINFPWGSLLEGLLRSESTIMCGLNFIAKRNATIEIRLNGGALSEAGMNLETGAGQIMEVMRKDGWLMKNPIQIKPCVMQKFPSTWAKRLAYGRDPRAVSLYGFLSVE